MWCQNSMERMPATLKISENPRKYHFLPRKSIFVLRKNSTLSTFELDTQSFAPLFAGQNRIENHAGNKNCREQVCQQTEGQRYSEPAHRPGTNKEQNDG